MGFWIQLSQNRGREEIHNNDSCHNWEQCQAQIKFIMFDLLLKLILNIIDHFEPDHFANYHFQFGYFGFNYFFITLKTFNQFYFVHIDFYKFYFYDFDFF